MHKLSIINAFARRLLTGNIEVAFGNHSGKNLTYVRFVYCDTGYWGLNPNVMHPDGKLTGNISIFAGKYDLELIQIECYPNISGEVKSLKNLKKLTYYRSSYTEVTGSKTDLYNEGVNITGFAV